MTQKTDIDWLRFRVQAEPRDVLQAMRPMFGTAADLISFKHMDRGILGFQRGAQIMLADVPVGRMDFGGESQKGWVRVDVPGTGCQWVQDWQAVQAVEELPQAQIRRLDIALTTWDGEITHEQVVQAHQEGRFITRGRPPELTQILKSSEFSGRTCYIGQREKADKFMRCYEKGKEMVSKLLAKATLPSGPIGQIEISGKRIEDIYRCEVELKAATKDIPWEVIERRDQYFCGSYPFCADVLPGVEPDILMKRPERAPQMELAHALETIRHQFGSTLFTALTAYQGDIGAVWDRIVGSKHNPALLEAGVLLVDHE